MKQNSCIVLYCAVLLFLTSCKGGSTPVLSEEGPFSRVIVTTTVHTALFRELGAGDCIVDTCEIDDGNPDIERIISMNPDAIFLSPYEGQNFEKIRRLGIPIVEMPDYLESTHAPYSPPDAPHRQPHTVAAHHHPHRSRHGAGM